VVILVTGEAGYIGSVLTEELIKEGYSVIALDNLQQGHRQAVHPEALFVPLDLRDVLGLIQLFERHPIEAVIHLAAETRIDLSMSDPAKFFLNNVAYGLNLLEVMLQHGVKKMLFSSTAAVYGEPEEVPIPEGAKERPVSPYGESKLMFERILSWYGEAYGLKYISLRYFNAAGCTSRLGEDHRPETHLIPNILKVALGQLPYVPIFGTDYDTPDGSCIRDYIHVADIAHAHILALRSLDKHNNRIYNLGNGKGYSVLQVIRTVEEVTGVKIPIQVKGRRKGDAARLVASSQLIYSHLGWEPKYPQLEAIISTAWEWHRRNPLGYLE